MPSCQLAVCTRSHTAAALSGALALCNGDSQGQALQQGAKRFKPGENQAGIEGTDIDSPMSPQVPCGQPDPPTQEPSPADVLAAAKAAGESAAEALQQQRG